MIAVMGWAWLLWTIIGALAYPFARPEYLAFNSFNWGYFLFALCTSMVMIAVG